MRTVFVSNRLPFTLKANTEGTFSFQPSSGGLASALKAYISTITELDPEQETLWVGWPGIAVSEINEQQNIQSIALQKFHSSPVFLDQKYNDTYYNGFCNQTLWPLFHYFLPYTKCRSDYWNAYTEVNRLFVDHLSNIISEDDTILVQDYHLLLLPQLLRQRFPKLAIGVFLHIPFPAYEVFRILPRPWQKALIEGMTGANLVGFHTQEYRQNFLESHQRIIGTAGELGIIEHGSYATYTGAFPISIDVQYFDRKTKEHEVQQKIKAIKDKYPEKKIIMSIDRLDYTKGIPNRLLGFEMFLEKQPEWRQKVVFLLTIVPSRDAVTEYVSIKKEVERLVRHINKTYGTQAWQPIEYIYSSVDQNTLVTLYRSANVGLLTPLRDGMNLVAKEFVASKKGASGALILSRLTGSALELPEALTVDPFYIDDIADKIHTALTLTETEQRRRNAFLFSYLAQHTVSDWASSFQTALSKAVKNAPYQSIPATPKLLSEYISARTRLLLFDYDGTLTPIADTPEAATPTPEILTLLNMLTLDTRNTVAIVSGREKDNLENWFGKLPLALVAEHGTWIKNIDAQWELQIPMQSAWKKQVHEIMESVSVTVPGSIIERKDFGIAWHYRLAEKTLGEEKARLLSNQLSHFLANTGLEVVSGKKVIEVKHGAVNKGTAARELLSCQKYDCVIAMGDDRTDEDLFREVKKSGYTFKVGTGTTHAQYTLSNPYTVIKLIRLLASQNQHSKYM